MHRFKENNCRTCRKIFCCKPCRLKHEEKVHEMNPDCQICIEGKIYLKDLSDGLLPHIKSSHWPLRCVNCSRTFGCTNELFSNKKCPVLVLCKTEERIKFKTPIRPILTIETVDELDNSTYESPPVADPFKKCIITASSLFGNVQVSTLTTSTPMQRNDADGSIDIISPALTPVECLERKTEELKKNVEETKAEITQVSADEPVKPMKRRVTFGETSVEKPRKHEGASMKGSLKKTNLPYAKRSEQPPNKIIPTPILSPTKGNSKQTLRSAGQHASNALVFNSPEIDNTIWVTATNASPAPTVTEPSSELTVFENSANLEIVYLKDEAFPDKNSSVINIIQATGNDVSERPAGIWSSMANLVKSLMMGLSGSNNSQAEKPEVSNQEGRASLKRARTYSDGHDDIRNLKKIKLTEIRCRRPIHTSTYFHRCTVRKPPNCDKATQTD